MISPRPSAQYILKSLLILAVSVPFVGLLAGCGSKKKEAKIDNTAEVQKYYKDHPNFFVFDKPSDIPANLHWEDGSDVKEFASPEATKGGVLHASIPDFPRTLRIVGPDSNGSFRPFILDDVRMNMARRDPNDTTITPTGFKWYPGVAEKWALDKATKTVYVKINPKARWSDGYPVTVDDIFFTFWMMQSSYIHAPWYNNWYAIGNIYTKLVKYDKYTYSITLTHAKPNMKSLVLDFSPMPQHFYKQLGNDYLQRYQWRFVPTTGAYVVKKDDIDKGRSIALTRLKNWWAKDNKFWRYRFNYDRIELTVVRDPDKAFEMFKRGDLDGYGLTLPKYWYDKLPNSNPDVQHGYIAKVKFYNDIPQPTYGLWINESKPLLDNRDIRVGINYATDWGLVCKKFFRGDAVRMNTTADGFGEFTDPNIHARPYDVDKALEYFAKAGFTKRGPDGILVNSKGERLSFQLTTGYKPLADIMTILKQQAAKAGLDFRVEILDPTTAWKKTQEKNHDIEFSAFGVFPEMYPRYWETFDSSNAYDKAFLKDGSVNPNRKVKTQTNNLMEIANPKLDKLIAEYRTSSSKDEMVKLAYEMEEIIYHNAGFVPGFEIPFYRIGYWRWIHYPKDFNVRISNGPGQFYLSWTHPGERAKVLKERKDGKTFKPIIKVYDQFAPPNVREQLNKN